MDVVFAGTEKIDYTSYLRSAVDYLIGQVMENGYISASKDYDYYKPHWIRDSSFIAMALLNVAAAGLVDVKKIKEAVDAASRIIQFNIKVVEKYMPNIKYALGVRLEDDDFYTLRAHIPARVGNGGEYFRGIINGKLVDDSVNLKIKNTGLVQNDSIPLILLTISKKERLFGLDESEKEFLERNGRVLLNYIGKSYIAPSGSIWEIYADGIHAYDVAVVYAAFKEMERLSSKKVINIPESEVVQAEKYCYSGGPLQFLRNFFIYNGVLYDTRLPFANAPLLNLGVDASSIFIFNRFGISGKMLGDDSIEKNTIGKIENELFAGNVLPLRFASDTYFKGGRWLLLGLEFASYYIKHGEIEKGRKIIDYVISKYNGAYPEQEIHNTATDIDENGYLALNGNMPIQNLAWSYASMVDALIELHKAITEKTEFWGIKR